MLQSKVQQVTFKYFTSSPSWERKSLGSFEGLIENVLLFYSFSPAR